MTLPRSRSFLSSRRRCASSLRATRHLATGEKKEIQIFQETLTNIIRHSGDSQVEVTLSERDDDLALEVKDNGRGISEAVIHNTKSIGLLGMRERASLLGGEVSLGGEPGKGTTVTVRIPRPPSPPGKNHPHENSSNRRPRSRTARS